MKIDKRNPRHWYYLAKSGSYILTSIACRPFYRKNATKVVTFYGHKYNGNLKAFADYCQQKGGYKLYFVILDPVYYREVKDTEASVEFLSLLKFRDVMRVSHSDVVISDRRAHVLLYYLLLTRIPFVDVWHGLQMFKRFFPKDMAMLKRYREIWVPSPAFAQVYEHDYKLPAEKIKVTGYARVDRLVRGDYDAMALRTKYDIPKKYKKIILLAPTWQQDSPDRQIIPFDEQPDHFLASLSTVAKKLDALVIFRAHLNTNAQNHAKISALENIRVMSHNDYPEGEEFLAMTDLFIGDWSSIAFDYLPLHRPAIFLDVPIPFAHGLTFPNVHRYGLVAKSLSELIEGIQAYTNDPAGFYKTYQKQIQHTENVGYGNTLDGKSSERYYQRLKKLIG